MLYRWIFCPTTYLKRPSTTSFHQQMALTHLQPCAWALSMGFEELVSSGTGFSPQIHLFPSLSLFLGCRRLTFGPQPPHTHHTIRLAALGSILPHSQGHHPRSPQHVAATRCHLQQPIRVSMAPDHTCSKLLNETGCFFSGRENRPSLTTSIQIVAVYISVLLGFPPAYSTAIKAAFP